MNTEDLELAKIVELVKKAIHPQQIILFGSRAKHNDSEHSDYDIMCIVKKSRNTRNLEKKLYVIFAREGITKAVDLIVETEADYYRNKGNPFMIYSEIFLHGRTVYDRKTVA